MAKFFLSQIFLFGGFLILRNEIGALATIGVLLLILAVAIATYPER